MKDLPSAQLVHARRSGEWDRRLWYLRGHCEGAEFDKVAGKGRHLDECFG